MVHQDHVRLIEEGIQRNSGGVWADFGSGTGAFTLALRDVAGQDVKIYSIDTNNQSLKTQKSAFADMFPDTTIHFLQKDFIDDLDLPPLDGLIAANSIHFHKNTVEVVRNLASYLKPDGKFIVVEYNADSGNMWVPYPFSFPRFEKIAIEAGLKNPLLLATIPSGFLNEIYSAKVIKP